jgi:hypothetical protein
VPAAGPATYAVFDIDAADIAALSGLSDSDPAYGDYVLANGSFLAEGYVDVPGLPSGTPFSFLAPAAPGEVFICPLPIPDGSVVGEAPLGAQVYWAPGKTSPGVVLNPGTYHVIGQDESQTYYKLWFSCQYMWVEKAAMQPSYLPPQNGAPLPQRIVS